MPSGCRLIVGTHFARRKLAETAAAATTAVTPRPTPRQLATLFKAQTRTGSKTLCGCRDRAGHCCDTLGRKRTSRGHGWKVANSSNLRQPEYPLQHASARAMGAERRSSARGLPSRSAPCSQRGCCRTE
eukprot:scaffold2773_cov410-Prasinococcus_capsulatus_cf.AAC.26